MTEQAATLDVRKASRLVALEAQLKALTDRGDHQRASQCSDLILELVGKRPFRLPETIA